MPIGQIPLSVKRAVPFLQETNRKIPRAAALSTAVNPPEVAQFIAKRDAELKALRYPFGVGMKEEYPHWLKIETHVRASNQKLLEKYGTSGDFVAPEAKKQAMDVNELNSRVTTVLGAGVGLKVGQSAGAAAFKGLEARARSMGIPGISTVGKLLIGGATAAAGTVVGAGAGLVAGAVAGPNGYKTLMSVIGLGLQDPITANYQSTWQAQELGEFLATGEASPFSGAREFIRSQYGLRGAVASAAGIEGAAVLGAQELASGKARNPYKEQLFKGSEFRTFNFKFTLLPESIAEAKVILDIITHLRSTMLPSLDPSGFYLIYPAEYTLTYMYRDQPNANVNSIGTCVLTDLSTRYGGRDFVTFSPPSDGERGIPAEYAISMTFKEIVPITADQVLEANL